MPVKHEIVIIINPEGGVELEIKGMTGPSCVTEIEKFASGVGEIKAMDKKSEFYQSPLSKNQTQRRT